MLLVFLLDTSASMNQKTCLGTSYLDVAKGAVEAFLKIRARDVNVCRGDRYMLVTFDESTKSVKAGWRENLQVFLRELKNLQGHGLSNLSLALKTTFDLLNMHRLQSGIDNYGMGYNPFYLEPALILLISDGCAQVDINGIIDEVALPYHNLLPGAELTKELYRWDQRLFSLNLQIPGFASLIVDKATSMNLEEKSISSLCDQTGGKLYNITSHKSLMQSMESIAQKIIVPGVIIDFEKIGIDPDPIPDVKDESITPKSEENAYLIDENILNDKLIDEISKEKIKMNGLALSMPMKEDVTKENVPNGYVEKDLGVSNNQKGLLPTPPLPPSIRHIFPSHLQMHTLPLPPLRALLPTPPVNSQSSPRLSMPPTLHISPLFPASLTEENRPLPLKPRNGLIEEKNLMEDINIKTEASITSSGNIPAIPIRGDLQAHNDKTVPVSSNGSNLASPNVTTEESPAWQIQRRMIFVRSNVKGNTGHWPIPESFFPEPSQTKLLPRDCHPVIRYKCNACEAMVIDNMPFDKYELEPSPLTQYILERKQPFVAWQTFISGSHPDFDIGYPFGYLKAANNLLCVNLFVLPYNYPVIMPLLDELFKIHKCKPTLKWKQTFEDYLRKLPNYYLAPLRNALRRMGAPCNLIPDHMDGSLSYSVATYLKKVKQQSKNEAERLITVHSQPYIPPAYHETLPNAPQLIDGKQRDFKELLVQKNLAETFRNKKLKSSQEKAETFASRCIPAPVNKFKVRSYKNPFDVHRGDLLDQLKRMRTNFFHSLTGTSFKAQDEDSLHRISISQMGKFEDVINQVKPLRDIDQSQIRLHTFGNPFKLKQDQNVILAVDEADVNENMSLGNQKNRKRNNDTIPAVKIKRKRSEAPLPSRRPYGPPNTPPPLSQNMMHASINSNSLDSIKDGNIKIDYIDTDNKKEYVIKNGDEKKENIAKDEEKKTFGSVNQQLRKLQLIHRNKKGNNKIHSSSYLVNNENKIDNENNEISNSSPILSILRTSLEDVDDRDNEELTQINTSHTLVNTIKENDRKTEKTSNTDSPGFGLVSVASFNELHAQLKRKASIELSTWNSIKIRVAVWQAIRDRSEYPVLVNLINQLNTTAEARYLFILKVIQEAERFQCLELCEKLKTLLPKLHQLNTRPLKSR